MTGAILWTLGIDGGGSGSRARLTNLESNQSIELTAGPANMTTCQVSAIDACLSLAEGLVQNAGAERAHTRVLAGLAGAGNLAGSEALKSSLTERGYGQVTISSDGVTSWFGASLGRPSVVGAIGTGSVAIVPCNHGRLRYIGGKGFPHGDEGSGAWIGREAVRLALLDLSEESSSAGLASLVPQVARLSLAGNASATSILQQAARHVVILLKEADEGRKLPWILTGGLATVLEPLLEDYRPEARLECSGTALDGACALACDPELFEKLTGYI